MRAIADEGSFIGAADALGYSQAAISQQVARLERAVGQQLFDRPGGPRPVSLTPAGRLLLGHATAIHARLALAEREMSDLVAGTAGRLRCGTFQSVSVQLLPELVREMRAAAPNLDIHLVEQDLNDSLVDLLIAGDIDVTFLEGPYDDSRLELIELGTDPFVVLLPKESDLTRLAKGKTFPTRLLAQAPLVGEHDCSTQTRIDVGLRDAAITPATFSGRVTTAPIRAWSARSRPRRHAPTRGRHERPRHCREGP
ncbi:MAG: LysR family transcriptional regulator, partial [Planctomycetes bacterium]|nr:LysR family transcriptional regulator [Planctomycetota bacterium]